MKLAETDVAAPVVKFLQENQWEVFQEVRYGGPGDPVADIVARQLSQNGHTSLLWVVEVKTSLSFTLLSQAVHWTKHANYVSIAVPPTKRSYRERDLIQWILKYHGIGKFDMHGPTTHAPFHRVQTNDWSKYLNERQKTECAAGSRSGYWTPFKETCENVKLYVSNHPGCCMKELIDNVQSHYKKASTARSSLRMWIEAGKVPGVRMELEGGKIHLFLTNP